MKTPHDLPQSHEEPMRTRESRFEVEIRAPRARVWDALTRDFGRWWPRNLVMGPAVRFRFEAQIGGRLWEDYGEEGGLLWGTVFAMRRGSHIALTTDVPPDLGGPARSILSYTLQDAAGGTRLTWTETRFGRVDDDVQAGQWIRPWKYAITERLKPFAEGHALAGEPSVEGASP